MAASKEGYRVSANDLPSLSLQLNFHFSSIANRLDQIEGWRGTSTINSDLNLTQNNLINVGNFDQNLGTTDQPSFGGLTIEGDVAVTGTLLSASMSVSGTGDFDVLTITDSNGTILHQMGGS